MSVSIRCLRGGWHPGDLQKEALAHNFATTDKQVRVEIKGHVKNGSAQLLTFWM